MLRRAHNDIIYHTNI